MNKILLGLLTFTAIGFSSMPARADSAAVMTSEQNVTITGDYNRAFQRNIQKSEMRGKYSGHTGTVLESRQTTDIWGNGNTSSLTNRQIERKRPRHFLRARQ